MTNFPSRRSLRVMLDATVLIAGSAFPRWPHEVLRHALNSDFKLVLSPLIIHQARTHLAKDFPNFVKDFEQFLKNCNIELIEDPSSEKVKEQQNLVRDKKDIPIALAAINARVDYIVSDDKDLTIKDKTTEELRRFVKPMIYGTFLKEVMEWTSKNLEKVKRRKWQDIGI